MDGCSRVWGSQVRLICSAVPLQMPKVQYRSNCKPSTFAYPPALEIPKEKEKEKVSGGASVFSKVFLVNYHFVALLFLLFRYLLCCFVPQPLERVWWDDEVLFISCVKRFMFSIVRCVRWEFARLRFGLNMKTSLLSGRYPPLFSPSQPKPRRRRRKRKKRRRRRWKW